MSYKNYYRGKVANGDDWVYGYVYGNSEILVPKDKSLATSFTPYLVDPKTVGQFLVKTLIGEIDLYHGDVFDIGQTVNGQSQFVIMRGIFKIEVYYNYDRDRPYEYDIQELLTEIHEPTIKVIGNIYDGTE